MKAHEILAERVGQSARKDPRAWAKRILQRHAQGDPTVSPYALELARNALREAPPARTDE